ncbi:LysM peptidoglycan-binding domain-containing protein [Rheinheimera sp.]|uniref:LysM peptidoglycan-binding domain-containing protein n=1 Tax=Rheinheimera sp. TaxID=1869214 RepID=UPI003AF7E279
MLNKLYVAVAAALLASCAAPKSVQAPEPEAEISVDQPVRDKAATAQQVANALWQDAELSPLAPDSQLQSYDNLWQRAIAQFSLDVPSGNREIEQQIRFYLRNQKVLKTATENAAPFLYHLITELERRNMPLELALLPIVESTYNPKAGSVSGVLGIWQFSAGTGRNFGLKQNAWYDGRRDVMESSRAAFDYLKYLYSNVDQDWLSAVAAFNAGEGRVFKALERNRYSARPTDFWSLHLPKQTTSYIPKLLALAELLKHPDKYAISVPAIANKPQSRVLKINRGLDLPLTAEVLGISLDELKRLNPGFKANVVPPASYQLVVPIDSPLDSKQQLAALPKVKVAPVATTSTSAGGQYKVRSGDSLSKIAAQNKISVKALQQANQLSGTKLKVGQLLTIPGLVSEPAQAKTTKVQTSSQYQVKSGDNLWLIAKKLNVSTADLKRWNQLNDASSLKPGQLLKVNAVSSDSKTKKMTYQVKAGDSLASIAQRFKVKVTDILQWNGLKADNYIQPGQELTLYPAG